MVSGNTKVVNKSSQSICNDVNVMLDMWSTRVEREVNHWTYDDHHNSRQWVKLFHDEIIYNLPISVD